MFDNDLYSVYVTVNNNIILLSEKKIVYLFVYLIFTLFFKDLECIILNEE